MNYLETGLPHTDFFPKKTDFRPPRYIPLCNLGRKYLGLEPLSREELRGIISRLCQPKQRKLETDATETLLRDEDLRINPARRFVGRKRMSNFEIEKMVDRLYNRRKTKDFEFVENTFEVTDFINMTDRDSDDESDDAGVTVTPKFDNKPVSLNNSQNRGQLRVKETTDIETRKQNSTDIKSSDTINGTLKNVRTKLDKKELFIDTLRLDLRPNRRTSNTINGAELPKPVVHRPNNSYSYQMGISNQTSFMDNRNSLQTSSSEHPHRVPRTVRTSEPWSRRTELVSRQVNRIRRPLSNPQTVVTQSQRVLNLKPVRHMRPEYALTRAASTLPALQTTSKSRPIQPSNYKPPSDDQFIDQVASTNTPRQR